MLLVAIALSAKAQLGTAIVDIGPYTPGSTIAATFQIDPNTCIPQNNTFNLYLSDASGSFVGERLIGSYVGFYSTFVNGTIPPGIAAGTGYKVRIKTSTGTLVSGQSVAFEIKAGTTVTAKLTSTAIDLAHPETFGLCAGKDNNNFILSNESTPLSTVTAAITNELNATTSSLFFDVKNKSFIARLAHYTVFAKAVMPDGTVATKAYFIINNQSITAFATTGNNTVCLPQGALSFIVDIASPNGIQNNFPGDIYLINWGDGSSNTYTLCDIKQSSGVVSHVYTKSSCGNVLSGSSGAEFNVFAVNISVQNNFCGRVGSTVSSTAKVIAKPVNDFIFNTFACTNTNITFNNISTPGENPNTTSQGCTSNTVFYNWYVDGVLIEANKPKGYDFTYLFSTNGNHTIRLESVSNGICDADPIEKTICVQNAPIPSFTLPSTLICSGSTLKPNNTSVVDQTCNTNNSFNWMVSPAAGVTYVNGTNANSEKPEFRFANPGVYQISLAVQTASCGTVTTTTQTVVVNDAPTATLAADTELCNLSTYNFSNTSTITRTLFTGTFKDEADTYTWVVTGGNFNFVSSTTANSKYPAIQFLEFKTYTITVTHKNNCGTVTKSQVIKFTAAPQVNAGPDQTICYNDASVLLNGVVSGSPTNVAWVGGGGTFTPSRNTLNATYTPTINEKNAGQVTLILRATTNLPIPCNSIADEMVILINPELTLTSSNTAIICTGNTLNYTPTSATAGTTFTWTATGSPNAAGFTPSGSGNIADVLTNNSATTNATVTYIITPTAGTCVGNPFTLTVTVTPKPIVTATAANPVICTQQQTAISLSANLSATTYTWVSSAVGVTGNTNNAIPTSVSAINDVLINNGNTSGTVTYTITPISANGCAGSPVTVTLTVEPAPTTPIAGPNESICNASTYVLKGNLITVGTGKWTEVSGIGGVTFSDDSQNNATVSGLQAGKAYTFRWTATGAASCTPKTSDVTITVNPVSVGGVTAGATTVCAGSNTGTITLSAQVGSILNWESSTDGTNWTGINNTTTSLNYANLTTTTQYRAVIQSGSCAAAYSTVSIITVNPGAVPANAGPDQLLCNAATTQLSGNDPGTNVGTWTLLSGPAGATFTDASKFNTAVNGLVSGATYIFRWTIAGLSPCPATNDDVVVTNYQPLLNNTISTPTLTLCNGQIVTITGASPTGGNNLYTYVWQSSTDGITWQNINGQTNKDLSLAITTNTSYRRLVTSATCSSTSNSISINALPPIATNTIAGNQTICTTNTPAALTGSQPTGGDNSNYNYSWEQSINNGTTWTSIVGISSIGYTPPALTQTTLYRRIVTSAACTGSQQSVSNVVTIRVNPNAKAEFTYTNDVGCVPFVINGTNIKAVPYPTQNATYTWYANGVLIGSGINFPGYTINASNQSVQIKLVTKSSLGCVDDEMVHTFSTRQDVNPTFTSSATAGCGPLAVTFTNTTPATPGVTYKWDFGNGVTSNLANPGSIIFQADPLGEDKEYIVTLESTSPCGTSTATTKVTVRPQPISAFSPDKTLGCSPFTVNFSNTSPGTNTTYVYDFGDGNTLSKTDKSPVNHVYTTTLVQDFVVKMTATNECGTNESSYVIRVSPNTITPELVVNSNQLSGCAPLTVDFFNNTKGATTYKYTFGDGGVITSNTLLPEKQTHIFTKPGTYVVELYATNGCSTATTTETITVFAQPLAAFTADKTIGCPNLEVKFANKSAGAVSYQWDFGDGSSPSNLIEPTHVYKNSGIYTVKLTAFNSQGCSFTSTLTNYIEIVAPPKAAFSISPAAIISIPSYTFKFTDESSNKPQTYRWDFGDGTNSSLKDPSHKYTDTGKYLVKLKVINEQGCLDSTQKYVQITGVPGYLYVPNSFIPGSTSSPLQKFIAIGSGIKTWRMTVFNKWGQVLWETTKLNDGKPEEGWDGTYKNVPQPQGIYFWKIDVELINGSEWKGVTYDSAAPKRTGQIYLIR